MTGVWAETRVWGDEAGDLDQGQSLEDMLRIFVYFKSKGKPLQYLNAF